MKDFDETVLEPIAKEYPTTFQDIRSKNTLNHLLRTAHQEKDNNTTKEKSNNLDKDIKNQTIEEMRTMENTKMDNTSEDIPLTMELRKGRWSDTNAMHHIKIHDN